jgi:hypothetical protein
MDDSLATGERIVDIAKKGTGPVNARHSSESIDRDFLRGRITPYWVDRFGSEDGGRNADNVGVRPAHAIFEQWSQERRVFPEIHRDWWDWDDPFRHR